MFEREKSHVLVTRLCEELAGIIGVVTGDVRITVSEGKAVKIEARQHVRACCVRRKANAWVAPEGDRELVLKYAPDFVVRRLEEKIVSLVGRFGYMEACIEHGRVTQLLVNTSIQSPRKRPVHGGPGIP